MKLVLGPVLFNWPNDIWSDFYARVADEMPVERVYIGEVVCSKREPFREQAMGDAVERLQRGGKEVVVSSLALVTLPRERHKVFATAQDWPGLVEANDVTAVAALAGRPFAVGPLVNVYNEGTLKALAGFGAKTVCLPPELPLTSIAVIATAAAGLGVETELFAFGRVPLAVSARCYHARIHGLHKDSCQFVCAQDLDGLNVDTLDGEKFLSVNGIQTMSQTYADFLADIPALKAAGVDALRLSPHSCDMVAVAKLYRAVMDGAHDGAEAAEALKALIGNAPISNGFLHAVPGARFQLRTQA
ncbi:putative protease [Blastochloris viridis]|nr:U32 family peptidase [Blastochloris viridis]BAR99669.1 putative protease [Blastochloris viridis]